MLLANPIVPSGIVQTLNAAVVADTTTSSTGFVDLLTINVTTLAGTKLVIRASFACANSVTGSGIYFRITTDGVSRGGACTRYGGAPGSSGALNYLETALAAGAHVIRLQWRVDGGQGRIRPVVAVDAESCHLMVQEVVA